MSNVMGYEGGLFYCKWCGALCNTFDMLYEHQHGRTDEDSYGEIPPGADVNSQFHAVKGHCQQLEADT